MLQSFPEEHKKTKEGIPKAKRRWIKMIYSGQRRGMKKEKEKETRTQRERPKMKWVKTQRDMRERRRDSGDIWRDSIKMERNC